MCHTRSSCSTLGLDFPTGHEGCVGVVANSSSIHAAIIISSTSQQDILLQRNLASATASWSQPFRKWAFGNRNLNPRLRNCNSMLLKHSDDQTWRPRRGIEKMQNHQKLGPFHWSICSSHSRHHDPILWVNKRGETERPFKWPAAITNHSILKIQNKTVSPIKSRSFSGCLLSSASKESAWTVNLWRGGVHLRCTKSTRSSFPRFEMKCQWVTFRLVGKGGVFFRTLSAIAVCSGQKNDKRNPLKKDVAIHYTGWLMTGSS